MARRAKPDSKAATAKKKPRKRRASLTQRLKDVTSLKPDDGPETEPAEDPAPEEAAAADTAEREVAFQVTTSRQFESWLAEAGVNLAFTTYQAGKLFVLGLNDKGRLSVFNRTLERCMGLAYDDDALYVAGLYQIFKFVDAARGQSIEGGYDSFMVPQVSYFTGDVDAHDLAIGADGQLYFVNTLFSCIATVSMTHSFKPVWTPGFIDRLAAEDRCHLNGMAIMEGVPAFATAVAETNVADGWREHRRDGGVLIDIESGETVVSGLSMPHSPRVHGESLWLLNSGTGHFGFADVEEGRFEAMAFCPGYLRGLAFTGKYAIVGLSKPRKNKTFTGLALDDNLAEQKVEARCGLYVIDLETGDVVHWVRLEGIVAELYDVAVLPERTNTALIGFRTDEIRRVISMES